MSYSRTRWEDGEMIRTNTDTKTAFPISENGRHFHLRVQLYLNLLHFIIFLKTYEHKFDH